LPEAIRLTPAIVDQAEWRDWLYGIRIKGKQLMNRYRKYLPSIVAALVATVTLAVSAPARANFLIRATDVASGGGITATVTQSGPSAADGSGSLVFNSTVGNFTITLVTNIATTGPGFTSASQTVNVTYNGPTGVNSDKLIIEVLGNMFTNPTAPSQSTITSNGSPSTSGLSATSVVMTSGVLAGNVAAFGAAGTTLGGQLGTSTGSGTLGGASSVLVPNPTSGTPFAIVNPFSFYQTYTLNGFSNGGAGSISAGSTVSSVPAPAGLVLALSGLPVFGVSGWLRRRKATVTA